MNDALCVQKYVEEGSDSAFRSLVQRHLDMVFATAYRRLGNQTLAEEAAQNVFVMLARKACFLRGRADLSGWLYKAAVFKAREIVRNERRRAQRESEAALLGSTMRTDDSPLKSLAGVLDEALLDLREKDRQALVLRFFEDKSLRAVGEALGVSEDAAQKRVAGALEALSRAFRKRGFAAAGTAAVAAALRGGAQAAPAGLLTVVSDIAVKSASGLALAGITPFLANLVSLTKTQTLAVCLLFSAGPAVWQWHGLRAAKASQERSRQMFVSAEAQLAQTQSAERQTRHRLGAAQDANARLRAALSRRQAEAASGDTSQTGAALYRWSENSDFVRVPKAILAKITLAEDPQLPASETSWEDRKRPVVRTDGTLSQTVIDALDLSADQIKALQNAIASFIGQSEAAARRQGIMTNVAPERLGLYARGDIPTDAKTFFTPAFPEEGARLKGQLQGSLNAILGSERTDVFWRQARQDLGYLSQSFGQAGKAVTLARFPPPNKPDSANYYSGRPQFYVTAQVGDAMAGESRGSLLYASQPPAWTGLSPKRLLPLEFRSWWPDLASPSPANNP